MHHFKNIEPRRLFFGLIKATVGEHLGQILWKLSFWSFWIQGDICILDGASGLLNGH